MPAYEFWLTDDNGIRLLSMQDIFFATYTRGISTLGTVDIGMSFDTFSSVLNPYFQPDWRLEVWRSPAYGVPTRREEVFMLRKPNVYQRNDGVMVIQFYGRNGIDLLNRRYVIQQPGSSYEKKTDYADDMMKEIVREQMLYGSAVDETGAADNTRAWPQNEFLVQGETSQGPSVSRAFAGKKVFDVIKEIKDITFQMNAEDATNHKIYFDLVPRNVAGLSTGNNSPLGWEFQTYADIRGIDRTTGIEFSMENGNISDPSYAINHLDEVSSVVVNGQGRGTAQTATIVDDDVRVALSRWNRCEGVISAASEVDATGRTAAGRAELYNKRPVEELVVTFTNTPGSATSPQSLYGIDWDLGDLVRVNFAKKQFDCEILTIHVSVNEKGEETITGRNKVE